MGLLHHKLISGGSGTHRIMFLHGFPLNGKSWAAQESLIDSVESILIPDLPGFGLSKGTDNAMSIDLMVDALFDLMDHLGWKSCVWAGLSMGGYITLRAYERDPSRFDAMALIDTKSAPDNDVGRIGRSDGIRGLRMNGMEAFASGFVNKVLHPQSDQSLRDHILSIILENDQAALEHALIAMAARTDTTDAVKNCSVPIRFFVGEGDTLTPPDVMQTMQDLASGSRMVTVAGAGHLMPMEKSDEFNQAFRKFVAEL